MGKEITIRNEGIKNYKVDESANVNPMLTKEEYFRLAEDMKDNGQKQPVLIHGGKILDGRNRAKAAQEFGLSLHAIVTKVAYEKAVALAKSYNDKRRHISKSQFAMKAAYEIMRSRDDIDGKPLPKSRWLAVEDVQAVVNETVSKRMVTSAIKICTADPVLSKEVFDGNIELTSALSRIEEKEALTKPNLDLFNNNESASKSYKTYLEKGKYSKQDLAKKLVELEIELAEVQKNN